MAPVEEFEKDLVILTLSLYNNSLVPRAVVQFLIDTLLRFSQETFIKRILQQSESNLSCDKNTLTYVQHVADTFVSVMKKFDTEYKRLDLYKQKGLLMMPEEYRLEKCGKSSTVQYMPLKWTFKTLLEIPGSFEILMAYTNEVEDESDITYNFIQGQFWRKLKRNFGGRIVIPVVISHDDFQCLNAFSSNAVKNNLGDVFVHLPGYPPQISSRLDNIFLAELFYAKDRKEFGNRQIFSPVIRELQDLERNGLTINLPDRTEHVYFCPCLYTGDNKALNEDQGFVPTFHFGRPCRICRATVDEMKTMIREIENLLRTRENYESDCRSKNPSETGVIETCCFNEWDNYHAIDNSVLDLMHDEFEGTAAYTLTNICNDLIYKQHVFDLDYLNQRIELFNENTTPLSNKIPQIKKSHITGNNKLKMSSAEMINFSRSFGLMVGEKMRESEDENVTWQIYITYREIIDILLSPRVVEGHCLKLEILIPEFLSLYIERYGHLKYKFHLLIHVIRILRKFGPLVYYWAMRMESKQRELKAVATGSSNTKNLLKTISLRSQLKLAYFKATGSLQLPEIEVDSDDEIDSRMRKLYFSDVPASIRILSTNNLAFKGIVFELGMMCVLEMGDDDLLTFGLIQDIFVVQQEAFILFQPHTNICFDKTVYSYCVVARQTHVIKNIKDLPDIHPCVFTKIDDSLYVTPKYIL